MTLIRYRTSKGKNYTELTSCFSQPVFIYWSMRKLIKKILEGVEQSTEDAEEAWKGNPNLEPWGVKWIRQIGNGNVVYN